MSQDSSSRERYRQAKQIALAALELPSAARAAFLVEQCQGQSELLDEVEWLITAADDDSADEAPEQFQKLTRQAVREVSLTIPLPRDYRLIRRINEGGMGVVYLAQRADGEAGRQVALKMLHLSETIDSEVIQRFETERRILSRLNHANIAHLIDGGLTAEGRPFLATEFVDGEPIDVWCQQKLPEQRARLGLFLKVCTAVDYAHRHMVIHRDLKPPNILVTAEGEPKLLDFGIAHLLDADEPADDPPGKPDSTQPAALTLGYASPEQLQGRTLGVATDVFSLGVLLQELLTGQRPYGDIDDPQARQAAIMSGQPDRRPLELPRDLQCIIEKATAREADARYESVRSLVDDLQRFLESRPVQARQGGWLYRLQRHGWRQRWAVSVSVVLMALLVGFLADREAQLQRIAWERDRAQAVTDFIDELFAGANSLPSRGNEVTVREILDQGTWQLLDNDPGNPAITGSIFLALGRAYNALGLGDQALPLLLQARQSLFDSMTPIEKAQLQAQIGAALDSSGRAVEAIAADEEALLLYRQAGVRDGEAMLYLKVRKLRNHANVLDQPLHESIAGLENLLTDIEQLPGQNPSLKFEALAALVAAKASQGEAADALDLATEALAIADQLYPPGDPRRLRGQSVYARALMLSEPDEAVSLYQALIDEHARLIGPSQRLANTMGNLGVALSMSGQSRASLDAFAEAAAMIEQVSGRDHYLYRLSSANLAALHLRLGEPERAELLIADLIPDLRQRQALYGGVETLYLASALDVLGSARAMQERFPEAAAIWQEALALLANEEVPAGPALQRSIQDKLTALSDAQTEN